MIQRTASVSQLRQLQLTELEILKMFDSFCKTHGLSYSLYAGSLLGAVRHQGFIPWDDDVDVCMSRADYDRFLSLWEKGHPDGYVLQNKDNSRYFDQCFSKIRKDHTTFLEKEWQIGNHHIGIFLDVFPLDRMPNGRFMRKLFKFRAMKYQLLTREFVPPKANALVKLVSRIILMSIPKKRREKARQRLLCSLTKYNDNHKLEIVGIDTMWALARPFAPDMLNKFTNLPFEGIQVSCFEDWDDHLSRLYGNYMQLPPESERVWKHHPILIDFDRNYEELVKQ